MQVSVSLMAYPCKNSAEKPLPLLPSKNQRDLFGVALKKLALRFYSETGRTVRPR